MNGAQYFESSLPSTTPEAILPDLARMALGKIHAPEALRGASVSRRHAARELTRSPAILPRPKRSTTAVPAILLGVKTFSGENGNQSPQHAVLLGMSGAGSL